MVSALGLSRRVASRSASSSEYEVLIILISTLHLLPPLAITRSTSSAPGYSKIIWSTDFNKYWSSSGLSVSVKLTSKRLFFASVETLIFWFSGVFGALTAGSGMLPLWWELPFWSLSIGWLLLVGVFTWFTADEWVLLSTWTASVLSCSAGGLALEGTGG